MKPRILPHVSALALAVALGANSASAAVIASADFEDNTLGTIVGQAGGSGWTNTWSAAAASANVVSGGLSYSNGSVASSGGSHAIEIISGTGSVLNSALQRSFSTQTVTLYMSFLWQDSANNESPTASGDFTQVGFDNASTDGNPNLSFLRNNGNLTLRNGTGGGVDTGLDGSIGTTYMIVVKATKGATYYTADMWVNPTSLTEVAPLASNTANSGINDIGTFLVRTAFMETSDAFQIDNIRIGTEWSDVVLAVPEPSAALLGGLGTLMLLRRRRPRQA